MSTKETAIVEGIEWIRDVSGDLEAVQCARCGGDVDRRACPNCGGEGVSYHDCGEDSCACVSPLDNVECDWCDGEGGSDHCVNLPEYCKENPIPGREHIESTALHHTAWEENGG